MIYVNKSLNKKHNIKTTLCSSEFLIFSLGTLMWKLLLIFVTKKAVFIKKLNHEKLNAEK